MIRALVFDIGGVLVKNPNYKEFWKNSVGSEKLRGLFGEGKISKKEFIKRGAKIKGLSKTTFLREYRRHYHQGKLIKPVFEFYQRTNLDKYILSDTNPIHLEYIKSNFKEILTTSKKNFLNLRKENISTYKKIIRSIEIPPKEVLLIDDKAHIIKMARAAEMDAILFTNTSKLRKDLKLRSVQW